MNASVRPDPRWFGTLEPGVVIDNCRLEARLGAGAFGAVYRAFHVALRHPRAFKFLIGRDQLTDEDKRRFLAEARHTARLSHPNIVVVHNVGEFKGVPFIHMEHIAGASLRAALRRGPLGLERALEVMEQILAGLATAHEQGIVHRDVKPENVMLRDDDVAKVVDFGLSVNIEAHTTRLTLAANQVLGTPLYMAPEQWHTSRVGPQADVWSAGALLYELVCGRHPFWAHSLPELCAKVLTSPHVALADVNPAVPATLSAVVDRMLAKSTVDRLRDAGEARRALRQAMNELAQPARPAESARFTRLDPVPPAAPPTDSLVALPGASDHSPRYRRLRDQGTMRWLPGGEFLMGSERGDADERPAHPVRLSPFLLDETAVSCRQYATFLSMWGSDRDDSGHVLLDRDLASLQRVGMGWEPEADEAEPVTGVTWFGALAYANWAGMHLPSEAQLEYVFSRAPDAFPDLLGTVRHWCRDTYDERFYGGEPRCNPTNAAAGAFVAIRGRSRVPAPDWSPSRRHFAAPHEKLLDVGFRCAFVLEATGQP